MSTLQRPQSNVAAGSGGDFYEISPRPFTVPPPVPSIHSFQFGGTRTTTSNRTPVTSSLTGGGFYGQQQQQLSQQQQPQQQQQQLPFQSQIPRFQNQPSDGSGSNRYSTTAADSYERDLQVCFAGIEMSA